jgi:hypothetical protein
MSQVPAHVAKGDTETMWANSTVKSSHASPTQKEAMIDGERYRAAYFADAQFVFSRVQHHFHKKTNKGYVPLPRACMSKGYKDKCKHDFPKQKQMALKARVICRGNARTFGVRVKGKRNALGLTLNRRTCEWQSGTCPAFAVSSVQTLIPRRTIACLRAANTTMTKYADEDVATVTRTYE